MHSQQWRRLLKTGLHDGGGLLRRARPGARRVQFQRRRERKPGASPTGATGAKVIGGTAT